MSITLARTFYKQPSGFSINPAHIVRPLSAWDFKKSGGFSERRYDFEGLFLTSGSLHGSGVCPKYAQGPCCDLFLKSLLYECLRVSW
jgi:hypothetical protein